MGFFPRLYFVSSKVARIKRVVSTTHRHTSTESVLARLNKRTELGGDQRMEAGARLWVHSGWSCPPLLCSDYFLISFWLDDQQWPAGLNPRPYFSGPIPILQSISNVSECFLSQTWSPEIMIDQLVEDAALSTFEAKHNKCGWMWECKITHRWQDAGSVEPVSLRAWPLASLSLWIVVYGMRAAPSKIFTILDGSNWPYIIGWVEAFFCFRWPNCSQLMLTDPKSKTMLMTELIISVW